MDFRAEFHPKQFPQLIQHGQKLFLTGSCFTEQIGSKLESHKFDVLQNPNGILFNPVSIAQSINSYIDQKIYSKDELFYNNEIWCSWKHHSRFSGLDNETVLHNINKSQKQASEFLQQSHWLLITLGSAFVYEKDGEKADDRYGNVVANCHKVAADKFKRYLLSAGEITNLLKSMISRVKQYSPAIKIIFTISPVRHLRDGFVENNRSKAALIQSVHNLIDDTSIFYFPAYELIIDDLRDYRFYAEDMVHPNYQATNYVWEKFMATCIDGRSREIMKEILVINSAINHRPFNPLSEQHKLFVNTHLNKISALIVKYPYMDFDKEIYMLQG
ncbi:MAG: GSCFA domain-containing protein [Ferruginibacter sp.]